MTKNIRCNHRIDTRLAVLWVGSIRDHFWKFQRKCSSCLIGPRRNTSGKCPSGGPTPHPKNWEFMTPPLFTHPLSIFVLVHSNMDSSHNLRMIHEGRTIVTILVSAGVDSVSSGSSLPGPAVLLLYCIMIYDLWYSTRVQYTMYDTCHVNLFI